MKLLRTLGTVFVAATMAGGAALAQERRAANDDGRQQPQSLIAQNLNAKSAPTVTSVDPGMKLPQAPAFKTIDNRGKGELSGTYLAAGISNKDYIVLLVHGTDEAVLKNAHDTLAGVWQSGRTRLALVIADGNPKVWQLAAKGLPAGELDEADASEESSLVMTNAIIKAYDKYVVPELQKTEQQKTVGASVAELRHD